jgi:hypothetical protein
MSGADAAHAVNKTGLQKLNLRINDNLRAERTEMLQVNGDRIVTSIQIRRAPRFLHRHSNSHPPPGTEITTPLGR